MSTTRTQTATAPQENAYDVVVGMEVHAQVLTRSKMFCGCAASYQGASPNSLVCPVCLGLPGAMPVINQRAVEATIATGLALNCRVADTAVFARKNYTYPDLPKGYQITQFEYPLSFDGNVGIKVPGCSPKQIRIRRVHLEEDTGKSTHTGPYSLVDLNRAGVPLMEIVTEADIASAEEAYAFLVQLRSLLRYLEVNSGDMEKGSLRCEPNISVRTAEQAARGELGVKVEVKNLNSLRSVRAAIAYEHQRQSRLLARGREVEQVNMGWDEAKKRTVQQRSKESSDDYRYFPEPDLPPLQIAQTWVSEIRTALPEMPWSKQHRYRTEWHVRAQEAELLASERPLAEYFEEAVAAFGPSDGRPQLLAQWISTELLGLLYQEGEGQDLRRISQVKVTPAKLAGLLTALTDQKVNNNTAKQVLAIMFESGEEAAVIIKREGLAMVSDTSVLDKAIQEILAAHPDERQRLQDGEQKLLGFFMGLVMRNMQGKADPGKRGPDFRNCCNQPKGPLMPTPHFKAVIWDLDGTLADSEDMHYQTWQITMASKGIDYSRAEFLADFGRTTSSVFAEYLGPELEEAELERLTLWKAQLFRDRMANELRLLPGAESWLEKIRGQGLYQTVASAAPMASIAGVVHVLNIGRYFTALLSGVPLPRSKPDPALFLQAAAALGVLPRECLVMEDSTFGVEAAHRAGMNCLVVGHRAQAVLEEIHSTLGDCNCRAVPDMSAIDWQAACDLFAH